MTNLMVQQDKNLKAFNTFGLGAQAQYFAEINSLEMLREILQDPTYRDLPLLVLGGGSNVLLTKDFEGLVLKINLKGIQMIQEDDEHVWVEAGAGVVWHDLVLHCIAEGWAGLENLSLIPGTVGAAPMQNIGAYGVEIKDVFDSLDALHITSQEVHHFDGPTCSFGYRESVFKKSLKGQYIILKVRFKLSKKPTLSLSYGAIQKTLEEMKAPLTIRSVSDAVIKIRQSKLPDPKVIGNAGSFFKNPIVSKDQAESLKAKYPEMPQYPTDQGVKIAAGWLIDQCGWKGKRVGNVGVHPNQALVLVHYGEAHGNDIILLAEEIQASVLQTFGIAIHPEVNFI